MKYTKELSIFTGYIDNLKTEVHSTQAIGDCPYCGKEDKFYYNKYKNLWDCKSCGEYGHTEKLAQFLEITHLFEDIDVHELPLEKVEVISLNGTDEDDSDDEEQNSEIRDFYKTFRNIEVGDKYYDYLRGRGYSHEYIMLNIDNFFKEKEEYKFKDYLIIPVRHKYKIYGFLGRIIWSKEKLKEHDQKINVRFLGNEKLLKKFLKKRYQNSLETKFSKLLYGIDDVKSEHTVIMVEGIFDKDNVDLCIDKYGLQDKFSCVCTFGKKLSKEQIKLLKEKGVDKILLFWDLDAEKTIRSNVDKFKKFKRVWLTFTDDPEKDAGNSTPKEIKNYISKKVTLQDFLSKRVLIDVLN